jgi:hypothetical protein
LYHKLESRKRWKDVNYSLGQQGRSLHSSFISKLKLGFRRFFRGAYNWFWNVLLWKDTQFWANEVLMIRELQASRSAGDVLSKERKKEWGWLTLINVVSFSRYLLT